MHQISIIILAPDVLSKHHRGFPLISFLSSQALCAKTIPSFSKPSLWISTGWLLKAWTTIVFLSFIIWFTILIQALQIQPEVLGKRVWDLSYLMNTVLLSSLTPPLYEQDMGLYNVRWMNEWLAQIYPSVSDACNRCKQSPANLIHVLWGCPKLLEYWTKIFKTLKDAFNIDIDTDPLLGWQ